MSIADKVVVEVVEQMGAGEESGYVVPTSLDYERGT